MMHRRKNANHPALAMLPSLRHSGVPSAHGLGQLRLEASHTLVLVNGLHAFPVFAFLRTKQQGMGNLYVFQIVLLIGL